MLRENYGQFRKYLPRVQVYYAVKANSAPEIVRTFYEAGAGFDVASVAEFLTVHENVKDLPEEQRQNFIWDRIIYANPIKATETLEQLDPYKPLVRKTPFSPLLVFVIVRGHRRVTHETTDHDNPGLPTASVDASASPPDAPASAPELVAVLDMGASAIRLVVAEIGSDRSVRIIDEASRGVLLGRDTFSSGAIRSRTIDAALAALDNFRHIMDGYGTSHVRAVATSAVREARNVDVFLDRIQRRTGIVFEIINESEESRLIFLAVKQALEPVVALPPDRKRVFNDRWRMDSRTRTRA